MKICAFTSVCQEDLSTWTDKYLEEAERLRIPFAIHFDRCNHLDIYRSTLVSHPLCIGYSSQNNESLEFDETHKQWVFDLVVLAKRYSWAMAWDIDETYERKAIAKLAEIEKLEADYVDVKWVNLWNDPRHIRVDGPFSQGHRVKFYNLMSVPQGFKWKFTGKITNGAKLVNSRGTPVSTVGGKHDLVCLHWGMMTQKLREQHKTRWDRIYTKAVGANPYGFWCYALDEENYPPVIDTHKYL